MKTLKIYDPAMCCSTGVCGPSVDDRLVKLAADVAFLKSRGITVERFNLGHQAEAFTKSPMILAEMGAEAENLPLFVVDGEVRAKGTYPSRAELASWVGLEVDSLIDTSRKELTVLNSKCSCSEEEGCC